MSSTSPAQMANLLLKVLAADSSFRPLIEGISALLEVDLPLSEKQMTALKKTYVINKNACDGYMAGASTSGVQLEFPPLVAQGTTNTPGRTLDYLDISPLTMARLLERITKALETIASK